MMESNKQGKKRLIIIGAGGFGREVLEYAKDMETIMDDLEWEIGGFLDDNLEALNQYNCGYKVLDKIENHLISNQNLYICAIGNPQIKSDLCNKFMMQGAEFINIIHPTARIGRECKMGIGNVICPNACLTVNVTVGNFNFINCHANCGHDSVIDHGCTISPFCDVTGFVHLENCTFLGSHATVCPGITIGANTKIGAGAAVISDIPSDCTAVGVPAKVIKRNL